MEGDMNLSRGAATNAVARTCSVPGARPRLHIHVAGVRLLVRLMSGQQEPRPWLKTIASNPAPGLTPLRNCSTQRDLVGPTVIVQSRSHVPRTGTLGGAAT